MDKSARYGVASAEESMSTGDRWPRCRPQNGDRVRFHFLTSGADPWLVGTKFHRIAAEPFGRDIICLAALTQGEEACTYCEIDSTNRRNMFACWIWTTYVLHPHDNPDEEGEAWEQKTLQLANDRKMVVFKEEIAKPQLLWLSAGRQKVWWSQFTSAWMAHGDLRKHLYELHRVGSGRDDTNYTLTTSKAEPLPPEILEKDEVKELPNIEDIFRETLRYAPTTGALLGADSLDGAPETLPSAPVSASEDDLI